MQKRRLRAPLRYDWNFAPTLVDNEFRRIRRVKVGSYLLYVFKDRGAWRWGIALHGTTILDGVTGTMIDAQHKAELNIGEYGPQQMKASTHDDGSDAPF